MPGRWMQFNCVKAARIFSARFGRVGRWAPVVRRPPFFLAAGRPGARSAGFSGTRGPLVLPALRAGCWRSLCAPEPALPALSSTRGVSRGAFSALWAVSRRPGVLPCGVGLAGRLTRRLARPVAPPACSAGRRWAPPVSRRGLFSIPGGCVCTRSGVRADLRA